MDTYLIFSDSHGGIGSMIEAVKRMLKLENKPKGIIFLGDNYKDAQALLVHFPELELTAVAGNCDISSKYLSPEFAEKELLLYGRKILILHGHKQFVKNGHENLLSYANFKGADVVLFGHTHERFDKSFEVNGRRIFLFNPGSIELPRDSEKSFGVLTIAERTFILSHGII